MRRGYKLCQALYNIAHCGTERVGDKTIGVWAGISGRMFSNSNTIAERIGGHPNALGPAWAWRSNRAIRDKLLGGRDQDGRMTFISEEEFRDQSGALKVESSGSALKFAELNLFENDNRTAHRTEDYEQENLIVRRGQKFTLACTFDRNVAQTQDIIVLKFTYGTRPQESKGTLIRAAVFPADSECNLGWDCNVVEVKDETVTVEVMPEPDCNIGKYNILIETKLKDSEKDFTKADTQKSLYMLFNAWCKEDVVYMEDESERYEYVLNDTGRIWRGDVEYFWGSPWVFGQFETPVLEVALGLLDKGELADTGRHSAVSITRCLSALANNIDDDGVLTGRWTKTFPKDCTRPTAWNGSVPILEEYHQTGKPVRYGQCWVFSGIITSLLRALGMPTRSVTNFASAHDHDCSMTIDMHFDENDDVIPGMNDSVWNYHVWNESFFRRVDLPEFYNGWQVHDATPQEASEGVLRCGPAPVTAVKNGHAYINFDVPFIFAEVNGDRIQWDVRSDGSMDVWYIDRNSVGKYISTKAVGSNGRHDLTHDYKYPEGSEEERKVVQFANKFSTRRHENIYKKATEPEVKCAVIVPKNTYVGQDMTVGVKVTNTAEVERTLRVGLTVTSTFYTGVVGELVKHEKTEVTVGPGEEKEVLMTSTPVEYEVVMNAEREFNLTSTCRVLETDKCFAKVQPFSIGSGVLMTIEVPKTITLFTDETAKVTLKNDTNLKLHNAVIHALGSFMVTRRVFRIRKVILPGEEISVDIPLRGRRLGEREFVATFSSDEITDVVADESVFIVSEDA